MEFITNHPLAVYNTLTRTKQIFTPLVEGRVGIYLCGPTVYGDPHLGHARSAITFDVLFRVFKAMGYKVRYVRNITDVGHLTDEVSGEGEDKIAQKARLEQIEPMEVAQYYTNSYHHYMGLLNTLKPSIEPRASGHIVEQLNMINQILEKGFAYQVNGSIYFDVEKYHKAYKYGTLSGRNPEDMLAGTRKLDGQDEKKSALDFALWKKASPEHIMRWNSPYGEGFPGWHLECSVMSEKYLGQPFDIHGGGLDLLFPHHECEIAQTVAAHGNETVKYWMHNNMVTVNGQKMGKSLGNAITLEQFFNGEHPLLTSAYSPMTIRMFMLQAHYRSTLDFSNEALAASRKAYLKIINGLNIIKLLKPNYSGESNTKTESELLGLIEGIWKEITDDLNTASAIGIFFNLLKKTNGLATNPAELNKINPDVWQQIVDFSNLFVTDVLGLTEEKVTDIKSFSEQLLIIYREAKQAKNFELVDNIRAVFRQANLVIRDGKDGSRIDYEE